MPPRRIAPHPILASYIHSYWVTERHFAPPHDTFEILPDSMIELVFSLGAPCLLQVGKQEQPLPACYLIGLLEHPVQLRAQGVLKTLRARIYPWGIYPLLGELLTQPTTGWQKVISAAQPLTQCITAALAEDDARAVAELQQFLIERALKVTFKDAEFVKAAQQIVGSKGNIVIEELAAVTYLSTRALRRRFHASLGIGPKELARTTRFEYVRDALWHNPAADLAQLALAAGYADQSHLQREFRQFSGRTPARFAKEMRQTRLLFIENNVRNLQDFTNATGYTLDG